MGTGSAVGPKRVLCKEARPWSWSVLCVDGYGLAERVVLPMEEKGRSQRVQILEKMRSNRIQGTSGKISLRGEGLQPLGVRREAAKTKADNNSSTGWGRGRLGRQSHLMAPVLSMTFRTRSPTENEMGGKVSLKGEKIGHGHPREVKHRRLWVGGSLEGPLEVCGHEFRVKPGSSVV